MYTTKLMTKSHPKYEITEKDIDTVLEILKREDPENATPEMAIAILENLQATFHTIGHEDPDLLVKMYKNLKKEKKLKTN